MVTPKLRFKEFSDEMIKYKISELVEIVDCKHDTAPIEPEETIYKMIRTGNVRNGNLIINTMDSVNEETYQKWSLRGYLEPNDIILTREAPMGEVAVIPSHSKYKFFLGQRCLQLKTNNEIIIPIFMYLLLQSRAFNEYIRPLKLSGSTVSNIRIPELKSFEFFVPSINEQKRVGDLFTVLIKKIQLQQEKIGLLKEQKKGFMQKIFSQKLRFKNENGQEFPKWEEKVLGEIGTTFTGLSGKSKEDFGYGNHSFITYVNVFNNLFATETGVEKVNILEDENQAIVQNGDILLTTSSETPLDVGMASIWTHSTQNLHLNSFCFGYRLHENSSNSPEFVAISLRSEYMRKKIVLLAQGSTRFNMSKTELMQQTIKIPSSIEEQAKIINFYKSLDLKLSLARQQLETLQHKKQAFMQQMFI